MVQESIEENINKIIEENTDDIKDRYIDGDGFVRKRRDGLGLLVYIGVSIFHITISTMPDLIGGYYILLWPLMAFLILKSIKMYSSHDIDTWKGTSHINLWIFAGSLIAGLLGVIIYYLLKRMELEYLRKERSSLNIPESKGLA